MANTKNTEYINGALLRNHRLNKAWTIGDLAEKVGVAEKYMGQIERGNHMVRVNTLIRWCKALEVSPNKALRWEDE